MKTAEGTEPIKLVDWPKQPLERLQGVLDLTLGVKGKLRFYKLAGFDWHSESKMDVCVRRGPPLGRRS